MTIRPSPALSSPSGYQHAVFGSLFDPAQTHVVRRRLADDSVVLSESGKDPLSPGICRAEHLHTCAVMKFESPALKPLPVFAALTSEQRREIASAASLSSLAKGECVFREAEPVSNAFLILSGHVKLSRGGWHRNSVTLRIAHPGEPFGMTGDLSGHQQTQTAVALCDCRLGTWPIRTWNEFLRAMPGLTVGLLQDVERRLAITEDRLAEIAYLDVSRRIAHLVLRLVDQAGRQEEDGVWVDFPVTRQEIAALTGTTLHSASRILTQWERERIVGGGRRELVVRNIPALLSLATGAPAHKVS